MAAYLKALREGDTRLVWKLDRLGQDLRHRVNTIHDLTDRGVGLKVLTGEDAAIDTTTASGRIVLGIFLAMAAMGEKKTKIGAFCVELGITQ